MLTSRLFPADATRLMLLGDARSGKTSIAFRLAYEEASRGGHPLLICNKRKLEESLPLPVFVSLGNNTENNDSVTYHYQNEILNRIKLKYIESSHDLITLLASLHAWQQLPLPSMVLLDDFSSYIDTSTSVLGPHMRSDMKFIELSALMMAYIDDTLLAIQHKLNQEKIKWVMTDSCRDTAFINTTMRYLDGYLVLESPHSFAPTNSKISYTLKLFQKPSKRSNQIAQPWTTVSSDVYLTNNKVICIALEA